MYMAYIQAHARIQKVFSEEVQIVLVDEWIQMPLKPGHHRPASKKAIQMAFRWRADDGPTLNAGLVAL